MSVFEVEGWCAFERGRDICVLGGRGLVRGQGVRGRKTVVITPQSDAISDHTLHDPQAHLCYCGRPLEPAATSMLPQQRHPPEHWTTQNEHESVTNVISSLFPTEHCRRIR